MNFMNTCVDRAIWLVGLVRPPHIFWYKFICSHSISSVSLSIDLWSLIFGKKWTKTDTKVIFHPTHIYIRRHRFSLQDLCHLSVCLPICLSFLSVVSFCMSVFPDYLSVCLFYSVYLSNLYFLYFCIFCLSLLCLSVLQSVLKNLRSCFDW